MDILRKAIILRSPKSLLAALAILFGIGLQSHQVAGAGLRPPPSESKVKQESLRHYPSKTHSRQADTLFVGLGDSLTHGTMDATNNDINTLHAYLQLAADSLGQATPIYFSQPLLDQSGQRISPREIPTNLGVDGADIFSMEGIEYYKRVGAEESFVTDSYLCDVRLARRLNDNYDKVLYPINVNAGEPVSQLDAAIWLVNEHVPPGSPNKAAIIFWMGNNDSSTAALGSGGPH